jgi:hypothetical protein
LFYSVLKPNLDLHPKTQTFLIVCLFDTNLISSYFVWEV